MSNIPQKNYQLEVYILSEADDPFITYEYDNSMPVFHKSEQVQFMVEDAIHTAEVSEIKHILWNDKHKQMLFLKRIEGEDA